MDMRFQTGQRLGAEQKMQLAPRIIQTMEIMQLPLPALEEKIDQELESNLALELDEPDPVEDGTSENDNETDSPDSYDEEYSRPTASADGRDPKMDAMANIRARQESLSEQLLHIWSFADVPEDVLARGIVLIGLIDADGFLTISETTLLEKLERELGAPVAVGHLDETIVSLQRWLEPAGIAARSLQESLRIQSAVLVSDDPEAWQDVESLIANHLEDLVDNRLPKVAKESGLSIDRVKQAIEKMHQLTLSPGRLLATERVLPVIPDAMIDFDEYSDSYIVGICNGRVPPLRISHAYEQIVADKNADEPTKHFIQRNINAARWIIEAVGQRKTTLGNIVQMVVDRQRDFLDQGDAYLRPLPMVEVADMLGIHVATVSRAVADKWVQTPRGIFPLRRFFSGGTASDRDGEMSWEAVKTRLKEIVDTEDKMKPLSDEALAQALREQGIEIARRTVVKYRQQLDIPSARLRKQF
jgi:RNA polymerase sigma-54 factor